MSVYVCLSSNQGVTYHKTVSTTIGSDKKVEQKQKQQYYALWLVLFIL